MQITTSKLSRWAGLSAMIAGIFFVIVGVFHPLNELSSVDTNRWIIVHMFACAMIFFGLLGMVGIYIKQAEKSGWLGLVGFILFSLWLVSVLGFLFFETFMLPLLATEAPAFAEGFLGMFTGSASEVDLGMLPTVWGLTGPMYILGGLLFGMATFRAGVLPRWAGALLAAGVVLAPVVALFPPEFETKVTIPVGLALAWMGYAVWSERQEKVSEAFQGSESLQLRQTAAD